jgi:hypothetical protein
VTAWAASIVATAREHGEARKARLLVVVQQLVTPVDGGTQRVVAGGRVAGGGAWSTKGQVQPFGDFSRRHERTAGSGELDR